MKRGVFGVLFGIGLVATVPVVQAATVKLDGVAFDVYYDDALLGLFGAPTLSGNVLFFTPTAFKAESLNGAGVSTANATLNLRVELADGYDFSFLSLSESGDYLMRGASSEVDVLGQLRVFDLAAPLTRANEGIATAGALTVRDGVNHNWDASAELALTGTQWSDTRGVNVTIENLLGAYTDSADPGRKQAFVEKKFVGLSVGVVPAVPEPESYALMLAGLGMLGLAAKRRSHR